MLPLRRHALRQGQSVLHSSRAPLRRQVRFESSSPSPATSGGSSGALVGGIAGALSAVVVGYAFYHFSGAKTVVQTSNTAQKYFNDTFQKTQSSSSSSSKPLDWFKDTAHSYVAIIPGASAYVDTMFKDIEQIQAKHGDEVDKILGEAKNELLEVTKKPVSFERVAEVWSIISGNVKKITELAGDSAEEIINNHPWLKEKMAGNIKQMKQMGEQYGPEAKKMVDDTWKEAQGVLEGGFSVSTLSKIQDLIKQKTEELKKYGDKAWDKGMEQVKPMLDQRPELKEQIEKNKDALLKGDLGELWEQIKKASESGNADDLKSFVQAQVESKGADLKKYSEQAWDKGMEQVKPFLDKRPELKEQIEKNRQALLQGDLGKLWKQVKKASESGNTDDLKKFVEEQVKSRGDEVRKYGEQAFNDGMRQAKPYLDKVPEIRDQLEKNKDKLMKGDVDLSKLWEKVKMAGEEGKTDEVKQFVQEQVKK